MAADFTDETPIALFVLLDHGSLAALIDNPLTLSGRDDEGAYFGNAVRRGVEQLKQARDGRTNWPMRFIPWNRTQKYLDETILYWRAIRDGGDDVPRPQQLTGEQAREMAPLYIDAFQSARASLLGEVLE